MTNLDRTLGAARVIARELETPLIAAEQKLLYVRNSLHAYPD